MKIYLVGSVNLWVDFSYFRESSRSRLSSSNRT